MDGWKSRILSDDAMKVIEIKTQLHSRSIYMLRVGTKERINNNQSVNNVCVNEYSRPI